MKVLQLFNNWKWTGPAEYAVNLSSLLSKNGIETVFACGRPPDEARESLVTIASERGLPPVTDFVLTKHLRLWRNFSDCRGLIKFINEKNFSIIHTHLTNGHLVGGLAARNSNPRPVVIRTCYETDGGGLRDRFLYNYLTDGIIAAAKMTREAITRKCGFPPEKVRFIPAAIDVDRFDPRKSFRNNRDQWKIDPDAPVVGIVARVQERRRFNIFLEGIAEAVKRLPRLRVMIIGRGTRIKELAVDPVTKMGLDKHFIFTGYQKEDYLQTLNCMDMKVFLVPGSDESCRAVREAMAMGKPVIVARRGMLPEIVDHNVNGLVIDDTPHNLAQAIIHLVENKELRETLGRNALKKAQTEFSLSEQVKKIIALYDNLCRKKRG